jgi:PAS domain S-box-containing protein
MNTWRNRFIALGVGVLAVMTLIGYLIWIGYQQAIQSAETTTRNYAAIIEARLDATLHRADAELHKTASTIPIAALSQQAVPRYALETTSALKSGLIEFPEVDSLRIFDATGELIYYSDDKPVLRLNISNRDHFRQARDNRLAGLIFSEVIISQTGGQPSLFAVRALKDKQGAFRGVITAAINLAYFRKLFQSVDIGPGGIVAMYRNDNFSQVLRRSPVDSKLNVQLPRDSPTRTTLAPGIKTATVEITSPVDGVVRIYSFHVLDSGPFFAAVGVARADYLAAWGERSLVVGLSGLLLLGLLTALMFRLWRAQARQAQTMTDLRESEARFRVLFEQAGVGVAQIETGTGRILRANRKYAQILGYSPEEFLQKSFRDFTHPDDLPPSVGRLKRLNAGEVPEYTVEKRYVHKDGAIVWVNLTVSSMWKPGEAPTYNVAVVEDITERKRAEEALHQGHVRLLEAERELLQAHESLAETDRLESVGRLAAGVAHEVKNPLTIIRLGVDYISKQFSQEDNQEVLDDVRTAIDRADNVIRDLLDFSRQKPFTPHLINTNQVIDNALHLTKHEIEGRNITIVRNRNDPLPSINADPDRLVQVFINLISNAAQAIGQNGIIEVVTRSTRLSERDLESPETSVFGIGESVIAVEIRDNGPGFPVEYQKKLFKPFFTTKPVGEGSGLGLAVSRSIVIMHRGSIAISNRPEGGASALLMFRVAPST